MALAILFKSIENKAGGNPVRYAGFDDTSRLEVTNQAPDGPRQPGITIVPRPEAPRPRAYPFFFKLFDHLAPQIPEL